MTVQSLRTDAASATLRLYDRPLHPELFQVSESAILPYVGGVLHLAITESGHRLTLRHGIERPDGGCVLTEVVGAFSADALPKSGSLAVTKATSGRDLHWSGELLSYAGSCHVDVVDNEIFERLDREIALDARKADLCCQLGRKNRLEPSALSTIKVERLDGAISIHAIHTFPTERAILRTQSLFELR